MNRVTSIWIRYGWHTPFVLTELLAIRSRVIEDNLRWLWLGLSTKGVKGRRIRGGRSMEITPGADFSVGDDVFIGARCAVEVSVNPIARLEIGSNTWISHDCHICSRGSVHIGRDVLIGEFVSIRDTSHRFRDANTRIRLQGDRVGSILIENDVWIGRGAIVLGREEGLTIGQGAVIGANSVVRDSVPAFAVVSGNPAKLIGMRTSC